MMRDITKMRDMTEGEAYYFYEKRMCPFCGTTPLDFRLGPRGGASINIQMVCCLGELNVIDPELWPFYPTARMGQVLGAPEDYVPLPYPEGAIGMALSAPRLYFKPLIDIWRWIRGR